jgi:hypothetical protein
LTRANTADADRTITWNQHPVEQFVVNHIGPYNEHRPHRSIDR